MNADAPMPPLTPALGLDWRRAHERCQSLSRRVAALDREIGRALLAAERAHVCVHLGYGGIVEYGERLFGFAPKVTLERLRVAGALEELPLVDQALGDGRLCYSAARELTRVAVADTEGEWLAAAAGKAVREVEDLVSGHAPGDRPDDPRRPEARRYWLRFEVAADVLALFRQAVGALRKQHGGHLDDEQALAMMARLALGGPGDHGRASHQIVMTVCEQCGQGRQEGRGVMVPVEPEVVERASCDAQRVEAGVAKQDVPPAVRRTVLRRDQGRCRVPGCRSATFLDVHHLRARAEGGGHEPPNLATLCGAHHDAVHRGALLVEGDADGTLVFRHADGSAYGAAERATAAQTLADAFAGLKSMGWNPSEARQAIDSVRPHVGPDEPLERVLRRCLAVMRVATRAVANSNSGQGSASTA
jgi:5-methylcytosine-specific restriction endonuclease McrA